MKNNAGDPKKNLVRYLAAAAICAVCGMTAFVRSFAAWIVPVYVGSLLLMSLSFAMLCYLFSQTRQKSRPVLRAAVGGAVFLAAAFGAVYLVNNVILGASSAPLAALIMTIVFALCFFVGSVLVSAKEKQLLPAALTLVLLAIPARMAAKEIKPQKYEHPFVNKITETKGLDAVADRSRLLVNADDSHWWGFWNTLAENKTFDEDSLNAYVMQYADSGVTDLLFNIFGQSSDTPTQVLTFRGDLYGRTEQHGNPVDYGNYMGLNELYNKQKIDIFAVWIEKCREVGIRPWLSLRMNDCHDPDEAASQLRGELFYTAEENGWTIGEEYGYYRHCVNYAVPEIRKLMLDYTREQLLRYDVFGIELDFMREIYCFDYLHADNDEIVAIMNDYLRDTAKIVGEAEKKWGHEIRLCVRMMRDIEQCKVYGFDVLTWCEEGLVDAITVTPRFSSNDSGMPIADWKKRCPRVEIWAGAETLVNTNAKGCCASAEVVRGYGAQYLTAGADGLYLFNYMSSGTVGDREREVYDTCGSLAEILKHPRRHILTYQDTAPQGYEPYDPLPVKLKKNRTAALQIETGHIPDGSEVTVFLGLSKELPADRLPTLAVNGKACSPGERGEVYGRSEADGSDVPQGYCREDCFIYKYTLPDAKDLPNLQTVEITGGEGKVTYAEILLQRS